MNFIWDFNTATLLAIGAQIVVLIVFLVRMSGTAKEALSKAKEAHASAAGAHEKVALVNVALGMHREQVAREFVDREALREMEKRLSRSIEHLSERIGEVLDRRDK